MFRFLFLFFVIPNLGFGQHTVKLMVGSAPFQLYTNYHINGTDSIHLDQFKFYVGNQRGDFQLVDASDTTTYSLPFTDKKLLIGMDSLANTSGKLDGAFDPLLGMYWAWNTGYIQLKMTGSYYSGGITRPFDYHIGGYRVPFSTSRSFNIPTANQFVTAHLDSLFRSLPIQSTPHIMLPGLAAQQIFKTFVNSFD
jgi:hypothetical protein